MTTFTKSDYGNNIDLYQDGELFFSTNVDEFLPEDYTENWDVTDYISEFLSFYNLSPEQEEFAKKALWSSKLRYLAEDAFTQWEEEN